MSERKDANLRKLALMALRKAGLDFEQLSIEQVAELKLPLVVVSTLLQIKQDRPDLTVEQAHQDVIDIISQPTVVEAPSVVAYDPKEEMKEFVAPYVEEVIDNVADEIIDEVVEEVVEEIPLYTESQLRSEFEKYPTVKNANTLLKKVVDSVESKDLVDSKLAIKLSKEYADANKKAAKK